MEPTDISKMRMPKEMKETVTLKQAMDDSGRRWQLSPLETIEEIRQRLRGCYFDEVTGRWQKICEPWMNEDGIGRFSNILNFYINKNIQLSYFEQETIDNMIVDFAKELSEFMRFHYKAYGVKKEHVGILSVMLTDSVYAALQRALRGKESQFIEAIEKRTITTSEGGDREKQSMMTKIPILGGRFK